MIETNVGFGVQLLVNGRTKVIQRMQKDLRDNARQNIVEPSNLHLTLVYPEETSIVTTSEDTLHGATAARDDVNKYLDSLSLDRRPLHAASHELLRFGRFLGVEIEEQDILLNYRSYISGIFRDRVGVTFGNRDYTGHVSVCRRNSSTRAALRSAGKLKIPTDIHLIGHGTKSFKGRTVPPHSSSARQPFANIPSSLGRR